ncbi:MAG TPA: L-fuculokinase, partial [bacterium]|nr:L-fuculokinase [bacterium]
MEHDVVIVIDCGSTNITMSAVDTHGNIIKSVGVPNAPSKQPGGESTYFIWDLDEIWKKVCSVSKELCSGINTERIQAVTITTFGADGAFLDKNGNLVYPVISWQCTRTEETVREIADMIDPREIYNITGYNIIRFNTLLRFLWLRKHVPEVFDRADKWLMTPGLISYKLTGEPSIDSTSAGTMMAIDMKERKWSEKMLGLAAVSYTHL